MIAYVCRTGRGIQSIDIGVFSSRTTSRAGPFAEQYEHKTNNTSSGLILMFSEGYRSDNDQLAHQVLEENSQFIKAVTQAADKREVIACENIYTNNGIKLVSAGTKLAGEFYDRLVAHKLLKPIEESLSLDDTLTPEKLIPIAEQMASQIASLAPLLEQSSFAKWLRKSLEGQNFPAPLSFKLTLMQEERPVLFQHSVVVLVLAVILGMRARLPSSKLRTLATAAVLHDIGELYIDPEIFAPDHQIDASERRYLFTHPITGYLMLRDFNELPAGAAAGICEHHERLDGTGYPYGLQGKQIGEIARHLAVAEFVASLLERNGADGRISMKLRLNLRMR